MIIIFRRVSKKVLDIILNSKLMLKDLGILNVKKICMLKRYSSYEAEFAKHSNFGNELTEVIEKLNCIQKRFMPSKYWQWLTCRTESGQYMRNYDPTRVLHPINYSSYNLKPARLISREFRKMAIDKMHLLASQPQEDVNCKKMNAVVFNREPAFRVKNHKIKHNRAVFRQKSLCEVRYIGQVLWWVSAEVMSSKVMFSSRLYGFWVFLSLPNVYCR